MSLRTLTRHAGRSLLALAVAAPLTFAAATATAAPAHADDAPAIDTTKAEVVLTSRMPDHKVHQCSIALLQVTNVAPGSGVEITVKTPAGDTHQVRKVVAKDVSSWKPEFKNQYVGPLEVPCNLPTGKYTVEAQVTPKAGAAYTAKTGEMTVEDALSGPQYIPVPHHIAAGRVGEASVTHLPADAQVRVLMEMDEKTHAVAQVGFGTVDAKGSGSIPFQVPSDAAVDDHHVFLSYRVGEGEWTRLDTKGVHVDVDAAATNSGYDPDTVAVERESQVVFGKSPVAQCSMTGVRVTNVVPGSTVELTGTNADGAVVFSREGVAKQSKRFPNAFGSPFEVPCDMEFGTYTVTAKITNPDGVTRIAKAGTVEVTWPEDGLQYLPAPHHIHQGEKGEVTVAGAPSNAKITVILHINDTETREVGEDVANGDGQAWIEYTVPCEAVANDDHDVDLKIVTEDGETTIVHGDHKHIDVFPGDCPTTDKTPGTQPADGKKADTKKADSKKAPAKANKKPLAKTGSNAEAAGLLALLALAAGSTVVVARRRRA